MEWSKIDKDWKKLMEERSIAPSPVSWDKLAQQLDTREEGIKKLTFQKWIRIAACLLVGGILGLVFWTTSPSITPPSSQEHYVVTDEANTRNSNEQQNRVKPQEIIVPNHEQPQEKEETVTQFFQLAEIEPIVPKTTEMKREKMDSLVIDEIWVKKSQRKVMVDSNDLLKQVEGEIEVEYRDTKLKKIINTTKKAVVDLSESRYEK